MKVSVFRKLFCQYRAFRRGGRSPVFVSWHVTGRCNLRCRQCFFFGRMRPLGPDLDTESCVRVVDQIAELQIPFLYFGGGEPLLREDLCAIASRAKAKGLRTFLFTNGTLISAELARSVAQAFAAVYVSLDGARTSHDSQRGPGAFDRTMAGIANLLVWRKATQVNLNIRVDAGNAFQLGEMFEKAARLGIHQIQLHPYFEPENRVEAEQASAIEQELLRLRALHPRLVDGTAEYLRGLSRYLSNDCDIQCQAATMIHPAILPDGRVSACCTFPAILGDLRRQPLRNILETAAVAPEAFAACAGCYRQDYTEVTRLFRNPWRAALPVNLVRAMDH